MDPDGTPSTGRRPGRRSAIVLAAMAVLVSVLGGYLAFAGSGHDHLGVKPAPVRHQTPLSARTSPASRALLPPLADGIVGPAHAAAAAAPPVGLPERLRIAAIGVNS